MTSLPPRPAPAGRSYRRILLQNTVTPINTVLFAIVAALLVLGLAGDALMTAGLVVANALVGTVQEARAKRQLDRIALLTRPTATVWRDGKEQPLPREALAPGDIIILRPGDQALVDGVALSGGSLKMDESLLTGESEHVAKRPGDEVYSGSFCVAGSGRIRATETGEASFAGRMTAGARVERTVLTPLQREIGLTIRVIVVLVAALAVQVLAASWDAEPGVTLADRLRAAAVLAALVPQGLAFMITVTYAMAAVRMAGHGALIQRMNAVESTSHVDVLCLDKTGTLTTNALALEAVWPLGGTLELDARAALACFAHLGSTPNKTAAALAAALPAPPAPPAVLGETPFDSGSRWSSLTLSMPAGATTYVLGAPEALATRLPAAAIPAQAATWTARGLRVLLFGAADAPDGQGALRPLALVALRDELRPEAGDVLAAFAALGVHIKIISGDSPDTVAALARQVGLAVPADGGALTGAEVERLDDVALAGAVERAAVFGRIGPEQKARIVAALRRRGHYVAMTGDGVNDVPALKQANLAVAMRSGSQVTRGVADIVLLNDSFAALPPALREGQRILRGMEDVIRLFLTRTLTVALVILIASLLGSRFPLTPRQNAALAFITAGIPAFVLALWARPGATPRALLPAAAHFVLPAALTQTALSIAVYELFLALGGGLGPARTALTVTTVLCGVLLVPFVRPPAPEWTGGVPLAGDRRVLALAAALAVLAAISFFVPSLRRFYELERLPWSAYAVIGFAVLGWAAALRWLWRRQSDWKQVAG